jgi:hypothetical protein
MAYLPARTWGKMFKILKGKLERLESWSDRKAGTTGESERPESWNDCRVGATGKLE